VRRCYLSLTRQWQFSHCGSNGWSSSSQREGGGSQGQGPTLSIRLAGLSLGANGEYPSLATQGSNENSLLLGRLGTDGPTPGQLSVDSFFAKCQKTCQAIQKHT
jgi:hypothetical protein